MEFLQIYKASAGSGKTHLLTQDYLKLAFENPDNFSKILAVTFTNKAAEEMKVRIIEEINNIINNKNKASHFNEISKHLNNNSPEDIVQKASDIRDNILHNYSMFSVSTIDSFVQKVIRAFSFEIGVSSTYKVEMDNRLVLEDLTKILLDKVSDDKKLQKQLIRFAYYKITEGKNWDFRTDLSNLASEIFKEKFQSFQNNEDGNDKEEEKIKRTQKLDKLLKEVQKIIKEFDDRMSKISEIADATVKKAGIDASSLGRNFKTIHNYLVNKLKNNDYNYHKTKTISAALESIENWYAKKAKPNVIIAVESVYPTLSKCLADATGNYDNNHTLYYSAKNTLANFHSFAILNNIAEMLPDYRDENNLLLISDTTFLLKEIIGNNDAPYIYEKIGNKYKHILIDEFQDTSEFQWTNFKPLIENSLSETFYNLIVGDIKQSIYRWRGGNWELLLKGVKNDIGENLINEKSLDTNWRSKQNIIDFNNTFFKLAPQILQANYNEQLLEIKDMPVLAELRKQGYDTILTDAYKGAYQKVPEITGKKGGRVIVEFIDESELESDGTWKEEANLRTAKTIDNLLKNKNYEPRDITILVRTNREGKEIVDALLKFQNNLLETNEEQDENPENTQFTPEEYQIISQDSLFLENSTSVKILINAMKFLYDERDMIQLTSLKYNYLKIKNKLPENYNDLFQKSDNEEEFTEFLPEDFINKKKSLKKKSLYEQTEELISIFELHKEADEYAYLRAFQDAVLDYTANNDSELSAFTEWWELKGKLLSVQLSDKQNAVKIMTVHKSKGLAFKVVFVPYCDWKTDHSANISPIIWAETDIEPFNEFEYLPIKYKKELADTVFRKDYFNEKLYASMDAINMLYVAFTRPKEELIIFAPTNKKMDNISSVSKILQQAITGNQHYIKENELTYKALGKNFNESTLIYCSAENYNDIDNKKFKKDDAGNDFEITGYPNNDPSDKISINFGSEEFFIESSDFIAQKVNYGNLMHRILAGIKTIEDIEPELEEMYYAGYLTETERLKIKSEIIEIINRPTVKSWFEVSENQVITEKAILSELGDIRIPDRIVLRENNIQVIDFKFGEERPEHEAQIREYMELISKIYSQNITGKVYYAQYDICKTYTD